MKVPSKAPDDGKVGVVVATYGDDVWRERGQDCALRSTQDDENTMLYTFHWDGKHPQLGLGSVRNLAAKSLRWNKNWEYDWLIFLDADDRLPADYVQRMREGFGDIRQPRTRGFYPDGSMDPEAEHIPRARLIRRNFIVIGAMVNAEMFWGVNGFSNYSCLEDWDLWLKLYCDFGAEIGKSDAVYEIGVNDDGRNSSDEHPYWVTRIRNKHSSAFRQRGWPRE